MQGRFLGKKSLLVTYGRRENRDNENLSVVSKVETGDPTAV